jgi:hypothetical protein
MVHSAYETSIALYSPDLNPWQITMHATNSTICYIHRDLVAHFTLKFFEINCTFTLDLRAHSTSYGYPNFRAHGIWIFTRTIS